MTIRRDHIERRRKLKELAGGRELVSTTEAAIRIGCCPRTVAKWFDDGLLEGLMYPESTHRRIFADSVERMRHRMETVRARRRDA